MCIAVNKLTIEIKGTIRTASTRRSCVALPLQKSALCLGCTLEINFAGVLLISLAYYHF